MAVSLATSGSNLALELTHTFPPKYWKKNDYENKQYIKFKVDYKSNEFNGLQTEIRQAQENHGLDYFDEVDKIERIQNPYSYAKFLLRKKYLNMKYGENAVYQVRKCKLIRKKYIDVALKYNCDVRRFGKNFADYRFFDSIPRVWKKYALIVVQKLSVNSNNKEDYDDDYNANEDYYDDYNTYEDEYNDENNTTYEDEYDDDYNTYESEYDDNYNIYEDEYDDNYYNTYGDEYDDNDYHTYEDEYDENYYNTYEDELDNEYNTYGHEYDNDYNNSEDEYDNNYCNTYEEEYDNNDYNTYGDEYDDSYEDEYDGNYYNTYEDKSEVKDDTEKCVRDSEFYIEYIVYFND